MIINKKRRFIHLPYTNLYVLLGDEPHPETFVDDIKGMVYTYSHVGFEGPTYYGIKIVKKEK
jgi:hypothetical protein